MFDFNVFTTNPGVQLTPPTDARVEKIQIHIVRASPIGHHCQNPCLPPVPGVVKAWICVRIV